MSDTTPARWHLYLIETASGALYTGITTDVSRRLAQHRDGRGAKALRGRGPLQLRHQETVGSRGEAQRLEAALKRLSAADKRAWLARRREEASVHPILDGIRLVVFDLDGTLVDSVPDLAAAVDAALGDLRLPAAGEEKVRGWIGNGAPRLMARALADACTQPPDEALQARALDGFLHHYGRAPSERTRLYPGVRKGLDALRERGLPLALVTNKPAAFIMPILESVGLATHFGLCLGGDSLPRKKPDPAPLCHAATYYGVPPEACLMVGDSRHDIAAGRAAGFRTLAVPYGYNHGEPVRDSGPDGVVESLAELV